MKPYVTIRVDNVDLDFLKEQREWLINLPNKDDEIIDGLICLIDHMADYAAEELGDNRALLTENEEDDIGQIMSCSVCEKSVRHEPEVGDGTTATEYCNTCSDIFCAGCMDFGVDLEAWENTCKACAKIKREEKNSQGGC